MNSVYILSIYRYLIIVYEICNVIFVQYRLYRRKSNCIDDVVELNDYHINNTFAITVANNSFKYPHMNYSSKHITINHTLITNVSERFNHKLTAKTILLLLRPIQNQHY